MQGYADLCRVHNPWPPRHYRGLQGMQGFRPFPRHAIEAYASVQVSKGSKKPAKCRGGSSNGDFVSNLLRVSEGIGVDRGQQSATANRWSSST